MLTHILAAPTIARAFMPRPGVTLPKLGVAEEGGERLPGRGLPSAGFRGDGEAGHRPGGQVTRPVRPHQAARDEADGDVPAGQVGQGTGDHRGQAAG